MITHYKIQVLKCNKWESLATKSFGTKDAALKMAESMDKGDFIRVMEYTAPPDGSRTWGQTKVWPKA